MKESKIKGIFGILMCSLVLFMMTPGPALGVRDKYLWVPNFEDHTVSKIDVETHEVVATIPVGENPAGIAVGSDLVYVVCTRSSSVFRIGKEADTVYDVIDVSEVMEYPIGVALSDDGYAFVVGREFLEEPCPVQSTVLAKVNPAGLIEASTSLVGICGNEMEIGIGINLRGDGYVPWTRAYDLNTGFIHFSADDLTYTNYHIDYKYYRGPGVGIDKEGNGWTTGSRDPSRTANFSKLNPDEGLTHYEIPRVLAGYINRGGVLVGPQQSVWLGTSHGLFKLIPESGQIDAFDVGDPYGGLALDFYGYIWAVFPEDNEARKFDLSGNQVGPSVEVGIYPLGYGDMTGYERYSVCSDMDEDGYISDDPLCMGDDCDDWSAATYTGAEEVCDGSDNDCDGTVPEDEADVDGDGWLICADDCDDSNPTIHPEAEEICDGVDNDCEGTVPFEEADADGDGWMACNGDCNDIDPDINPGVLEKAVAGACSDGKDNDCDGLIDTDPECEAAYVPGVYPTIQAGIDTCTDGDIVLVAPGTYMETIDFQDKAITLQSEAGAAATIIDGGYLESEGSVVTVENTGFRMAVIDGFTVRNGFAESGGGIYCSASNLTINNCTISENTGVFGGGIACVHDSILIINNCTISGNSAVDDGSGGGIYGNQSSLVIARSVISSNDADFSGGGINLDHTVFGMNNSVVSFNFSSYFGGGIASSASVSTMKNCTIIHNIASWSELFGTGLGGGIFSLDISSEIKNSIIWNNRCEDEDDFCQISTIAEAVEVSHSDIEGGWPGDGNIDADPRFYIGGLHGTEYYHLTFGSPCIDSGTLVLDIQDIDGDIRPLGSGFDMGADEYPDCWDLDMDEYGATVCGGYDCDDKDHFVNPGIEEICDNGIDDDCDGFIDEPLYGDLSPFSERDCRLSASDFNLSINCIRSAQDFTGEGTEMIDVAPVRVCDGQVPMMAAPDPDGKLDASDASVLLQAASGYVELVPECP